MVASAGLAPFRASAITGVLQAARLAFSSSLTRLGPVALRPRLPPGLPLSRALLALVVSPNLDPGFRELPKFRKVGDKSGSRRSPPFRAGFDPRAVRELSES